MRTVACGANRPCFCRSTPISSFLQPRTAHRAPPVCKASAPAATPATPPDTDTGHAVIDAQAARAGNDPGRRRSHAASTRGSNGKAFILVEETCTLTAMLEDLKGVATLAVDSEGFKLGDKTEGKLTLLQLSARLGSSKQLRVWLVDVLKLQGVTFSHHTDDKAVCLKRLLEDPNVTKLMFDVRGDSAQLAREFDVKLRGTYDLQLAEVAVRQLQRIPTSYVLTLDKVLSTYLPRTPALAEDLVLGYEVSRAYHYTNRTEVWEQRPLTPELLQYAASDVRHLHQLQDALNMKLPPSIVTKVRDVSTERVLMPAAAADRRAEAPTIVKKSDISRLIYARPTPPTTATNTSDGKSAAGQAAGAGDGNRQAGEEGGRQGAQRKGRGSKVVEEPSAPRAPPARLSLSMAEPSRGQGLDEGSWGADGIPFQQASTSGVHTHHPAFVLQPLPSPSDGSQEPYVWKVSIEPVQTPVQPESEPEQSQQEHHLNPGDLPQTAEGPAVQGQNGSSSPSSESSKADSDGRGVLLWKAPAAPNTSSQLVRPAFRRPGLGK